MRLSFKSSLSFWTIILLAFCYGMSGPAFAAETYYVSPYGSDSNSGSEASPWRSLSFAESQLSNGDTLELMGGTYRDYVTISVSNVTIKKYKNETPTIDGEFTRPGGALPNPALYQALVNVTGYNVVIDGLKVINSTGEGISVEDTKNSTVKNCTVSHTYAAGIKVGRDGVSDGYNVIDNCIVTYGNYSRDTGIENAWFNIGQNVQIKGGRNTVKNCVVAYAPTSGIEGYQDEHSTIENNVVYGNGLTQIHMAFSRYGTIRNNLIYGAERSAVSDKYGYGTGIDLACELWYNGADWDTGHTVYGNFIANVQDGIELNWQTGKSRDYPYNSIKNCKIYNNTVINPYPDVPYPSQQARSLRIRSDGDSVSHIGAGHVIKNNIFWNSNGNLTYGVADSSKIDMGYNLWNKAPDSSFRKPTDPTYNAGYPNLHISDYFSKAYGWNELTGNSLKGNEFSLLSTAVYAIGKGTNSPVASPSEIFLQISSVDFSNDQFYWLRVDSLPQWEIGAGFVNGVATNASLLPPILYIAN
jgi:parallel beta-helix repeat protein